jgi:TatA/E family protein of Tat protein translocase
MGPIGVQEMIVIFLVALVLFGPKKLPELGKTIAKAVSEFRRAQSDFKATLDREMQALERENESLKEVTRQAAVDFNSYSDIDLLGGPAHEPQADPKAFDTAPSDFTAIETPTVSASAVPGAESQGTSPAAPHQDAAQATPGVEGTIPRTEVSSTEGSQPDQTSGKTEPLAETAAKVEPHPAPETVQHS